MKNLILKWLGLDNILNKIQFQYLLCEKIHDDIIKNNELISVLWKSLDSRREEINGIIETLQNLDNHEVISDLHKRIQNLEQRFPNDKI
jgi:predicted nucleic-acid-binding protein